LCARCAATKDQVAGTWKAVALLKLTARVDSASSEALNGTDRVYFMRIEGNKLLMRSRGVIVPTTVNSALLTSSSNEPSEPKVPSYGLS
jgi:hypothetical protein